MPLRTLLIALLAVVALAGCGRRGELEEPGAATPAANAAAPSAVLPGSGLSPLDPGSPGHADALPPPEKAPQKRFLLDFLL